jgi:hypothetical protein
MTNMQVGQTPQVTLQALLPSGGREQLSSAQQQVATAIADFRAGQPSAVDSGDWAFFAAAFRGSAGMDPRFNLTDLPPEIAQMILDSQAKTMEQFFESWSKSIAENAKADKEASGRAEQLKEQLDKPMDIRRQRLLFSSALNRLVMTNQISPTVAKEMAEQAGLGGTLPSPPMAKTGWQPVPQQQLAAAFVLPAGGKTGVST